MYGFGAYADEAEAGPALFPLGMHAHEDGGHSFAVADLASHPVKLDRLATDADDDESAAAAAAATVFEADAFVGHGVPRARAPQQFQHQQPRAYPQQAARPSALDLMSPQSMSSSCSTVGMPPAHHHSLPAASPSSTLPSASDYDLSDILTAPGPGPIDLPVHTSANASRAAVAANARRVAQAQPVAAAAVHPHSVAAARVKRVAPEGGPARRAKRVKTAAPPAVHVAAAATSAPAKTPATPATVATEPDYEALARASSHVPLVPLDMAPKIEPASPSGSAGAGAEEGKETAAAAAASTAGKSAAELRALRRKKHNEIELRRRERMKLHFSQLDGLCIDVHHRASQASAASAAASGSGRPASAGRRRRANSGSGLGKDKDSILVSAIQQILIYRTEIERLRSKMDSPGNPELHLDTSGVVLHASSSVSSLVGVRPEQVGRLNVSETVHPTDLPHLTRAMDRIRSRECRSQSIQLRCRAASGQFEPVRCLLTAMDAGFRMLVHEA